ncbi:hypothetical protein Syun_029889 [Stephania yunnanensis]|uniref:Uncharacterized protein n=1 Tax=Stephania yunnanensis TaxID=152371 RepID=A0AAP0HLS5_9MAGN
MFFPSLTTRGPTFPGSLSLSPPSLAEISLPNPKSPPSRLGARSGCRPAAVLVLVLMQSSVREVVKLYETEKSFVVEVQRALSGLRYTALIAPERLSDSPGYASAYSFFDLVGYSVVTPSWRSIGKVRGYTFNINLGAVELLELDSFGFNIIPSSLPVDDEAVYLNVASECPKGRVYGLGSLGRKNRRYADPGASTSQMPEIVPRADFDIVVEQLRKVMAFMHQQLGMTMDGVGLTQAQPPPPPHDQRQPP